MTDQLLIPFIGLIISFVGGIIITMWMILNHNDKHTLIIMSPFFIGFMLTILLLIVWVNPVAQQIQQDHMEEIQNRLVEFETKLSCTEKRDIINSDGNYTTAMFEIYVAQCMEMKK